MREPCPLLASRPRSKSGQVSRKVKHVSYFALIDFMVSLERTLENFWHNTRHLSLKEGKVSCFLQESETIRSTIRKGEIICK
jgi:hypothetical protein